MDNPWEKLDLSGKCLVLEDDKPRLLQANEKRKPGDDHYIHTELLPEPYLGRLHAEIILLNLNPGYSTRDANFYKHKDVREAWRKNLWHQSQSYPFYLLNPKFCEAPGHQWWWQALSSLHTFDLKTLANHLLCLEYFPYHSERYHSLREPPLLSQEYTFDLLRQCLVSKPLIIYMRHRTRWQKRVPELVGYTNSISVKNPRVASLSEGNLPDDGLPRIKEILEPFR